MALTAKHLSYYLPYKLSLYSPCISGDFTMHSLDIYLIDGIDLVSDIDKRTFSINHVKPYLRPIKHIIDYFRNIGYSYIGFYIKTEWLNKPNINEVSFGIMKLLLEHHFDVFGLIDSGLAFIK